MKTYEQKTVGEVVAEDYRTAAVFEKYGIDFCCKGHTPFTKACEKRDLDIATVLSDIAQLSAESSDEADYKSWSADKLIDHIETTHHRYVEEKTPVILQFLQKLCKVHGERHPELFQIYELFLESAGDMAQHMKKEELILFPRIRKMVSGQYEKMARGGVVSPISVMMHEHDTEGERFRAIATLSDHYQAPSDGCTTYRVAYAMLKEFEQDLHRHIHLENNILFPKALKIEENLVN